MPDFSETNPRVQGALTRLQEIVERLTRGDLVIGDFYINASLIDPDRMNIEMKIVRGTGGPPTDGAQVRYAQAREADLTQAREIEADLKQAREMLRAAEQKARANGRPPEFLRPLQPTPPRPVTPKLINGARILDLD